MPGKIVLYVFVALWAAAFVGSILISTGIEGPRNIDTGFKRLDVLARGQILALCLAVASAAAGFLIGGGKRQKFIGLIPLALTVLIVVVGVLLIAFWPEPTMEDISIPSKPTATEPAAPALSDN